MLMSLYSEYFSIGQLPEVTAWIQESDAAIWAAVHGKKPFDRTGP